MKLSLLFAAAMAILAASPAAAFESVQSLQFGNSSSEVVTEVGNQVAPVTINQSSQFNSAVVVQQTLNGTPSATITQTGTNNTAGVNQTGAITSAAIAQFGATNSAHITQAGNMNTGLVTQLGVSNSSVVSQSGL
jgi:minor curlin subunit